MPQYYPKAVVFVDILGIREQLEIFQAEALENDDPNLDFHHESPRLNSLVEKFKETIALLKRYELSKHYLFSDNICITIDYPAKPDLLMQLPILVSEIAYQFGKEGYFMRGGSDEGWFADDEDIAIGIPMLNTYKM